MALESLLTSLKNEVSGVSGVQPCSRAALQRYPMKFEEVSGVSQCVADALPDTFDTSRNRQGYQRKPAPIGACTPDTLDTPQKAKTESESTHAEILERHPDAIAAQPFTPTIRQPSAPMTASEETAIRAWLALIDETDPAIIAEVIGQCQRDAEARDYFTGRAAVELPRGG